MCVYKYVCIYVYMYTCIYMCIVYVYIYRSTKLVSSAEAMGSETSVALKAQTEQMKATNQDITAVDEVRESCDMYK